MSVLANGDSDLALYYDHVMNNYLLKSGLHGSNGHRHQLMHQLTLLCASEQVKTAGGIIHPLYSRTSTCHVGGLRGSVVFYEEPFLKLYKAHVHICVWMCL